MHYFKKTVLALSLILFSLEGNASEMVLTAVTGEVMVNGRQVASGKKVRPGHVITTNVGKATLLMGKDSVVHIGSKTKFVVENYEANASNEVASVSMPYGKTRALIRKRLGKNRKFKIRTRSAVMGVRGTHIFIDQPDATDTPSRFVTIEGSAQLSYRAEAGASTQTISLNANEGVEVAAGSGSPPPPEGPGEGTGENDDAGNGRPNEPGAEGEGDDGARDNGANGNGDGGDGDGGGREGSGLNDGGGPVGDGGGQPSSRGGSEFSRGGTGEGDSGLKKIDIDPSALKQIMLEVRPPVREILSSGDMDSVQDGGELPPLDGLDGSALPPPTGPRDYSNIIPFDPIADGGDSKRIKVIVNKVQIVAP